MMIQTAGGPGLVSPIDYAERRRRIKPAIWVAVGLVTTAHVAVAVLLYNQRFQIEAEPPAPDRSFEISLLRPPVLPQPQPDERLRTPPAANIPIHRTPAPTTPVETLTAVAAETPAPPGPIAIAALTPPEASGAAAEPTPPSPPVITNPRWQSRPSADQLMRAYPQRAIERGVSGTTSLRCTVRVDGTLTDCSAIGETPMGQGFGRAGVQLSRYFRMSPRTVDGQPVDGAAVTFTVRFNLAD